MELLDGLRPAIARALQALEGARGTLYDLACDPEVLGPGVARASRNLVNASIAAFLVLQPVSLILAYAGLISPLSSALPALILLAPLAVTPAWRAVLRSGLEKELPSVLAYLLPYTKSAFHIVDLLVMLKSNTHFRWFRYEASRLEYLMTLLFDPLAALKRLATTTPSPTLSRLLFEYLHAQKLGAPRSELTMLLFRGAIDNIRGQWRAYTDFGKFVTEAVIAAMVASVAVAPIAALVGGGTSIIIFAPLIVAPVGSIVMLLARPSMGDTRPPPHYVAVALILPFASFAAGVTLSLYHELALLVAGALVVEALSHLHGRRVSSSLNSLRAAVDEARFGRDYRGSLEKAKGVAPGVIESIERASTIAGTAGVSEMLSQLHAVIDEAFRQVRSASAHAIALSLVSIAVPGIAVYSLGMVGEAVKAASDLGILGGNASLLPLYAGIIAAGSPIVALPASVLHRGWLPSSIPGAVALSLALLAYASPSLVA